MNAICAVSTDHTVPKWKHHYPRKAHKFKHSFSLISCLRMDQTSWQYSCHLHNLNSDSSSWAVTFPAASCFSIHLSAHPSIYVRLPMMCLIQSASLLLSLMPLFCMVLLCCCYSCHMFKEKSGELSHPPGREGMSQNRVTYTKCKHFYVANLLSLIGICMFGFVLKEQ